LRRPIEGVLARRWNLHDVLRNGFHHPRLPDHSIERLPWILGALLALGDLGFVVYNFLLVLAPRYAWSGLLAPAGLTALALGLWLFAKGVDLAKWVETNASGARP